MANREARLIMVTDVNNNKYYNMIHSGGPDFDVEYGRVDKTKVTRSYPLEMWEHKYDEKIRKGYRDITHLSMEPVVQSSARGYSSGDPVVTKLINKLSRYAIGSIRRNYMVSSQSVTQAQVDEAQDILDALAGKIDAVDNRNSDIYIANRYLLDLYHVIPRLMDNVKSHLLEPKGNLKSLANVIALEQANLDVMSQQVRSHQVDDNDTNSNTINIEVSLASEEDIALVKAEAEEESDRIRKVYRVTNLDTQAQFDADLAEMLGKSPERGKTKMLWHGSRNENWLSILDTGLLIRPTGVATTGSMFGNGIYFAPRARKSMGYTSVRGSYWAGGRDDTAYMALYHVRVGNQLRMTKHDSTCYRINRSYLERKGGYDSVYAMRNGGFLLNDENIVYAPAQCTVAYLVEIS